MSHLWGSQKTEKKNKKGKDDTSTQTVRPSARQRVDLSKRRSRSVPNLFHHSETENNENPNGNLGEREIEIQVSPKVATRAAAKPSSHPRGTPTSTVGTGTASKNTTRVATKTTVSKTNPNSPTTGGTFISKPSNYAQTPTTPPVNTAPANGNRGSHKKAMDFWVNKEKSRYF